MAFVRYPLEALLKSRNWELDEMKQRLRAEHEAVLKNEDAAERLRTEIAQAESDLRREGGVIAVDRRRLVALYARERRARLADRQGQIDLGRKALAKHAGEMALLRRSLKALERHRERYLKALAARLEKNQEKALEDAWLGRRAHAHG
jgi:hypothetical protein